MTPSELHPFCRGLETDYLHFLAALGWMLSGALTCLFVVPRAGGPIVWSERVRRLVSAMAMLLLGTACTVGVLDTYRHLLEGFENFGLVAESASVAVVMLGLVIVPMPEKLSAHMPLRWWRTILVGGSAAFIVLGPALISWWMLFTAAVAGLCLLMATDVNVARFRGRFSLSVERLVGVMLCVVAIGWAVPDLLCPTLFTAASSTEWIARGVGLAQGMILAGGAWLVFGCLWILYLRRRTLPRIRTRRGMFGLQPAYLLPAVEIVVLVCGFLFARANSLKVEGFIGRRVVAEIRAVAAAIDWDVPYPYERSSSGNFSFDAAFVRARLDRLLASTTPCFGAVIWEMDRGMPRIVAEAKNRMGELPRDWSVYLSRASVEAQPRPTVSWHNGPLQYSWALATIPTQDFELDHPGWILSLAIDGRGLADPIAAHRLQSLAIVALVALLVAFGVVHSVRSLSETELRALKEKAEAENHAKNEFLAMVSHEVRTPLQSVLGFAELAEASHLPESAARHVRAVRSQGAVLLRIVQDILDFSALRSGQLHLVPETVSLREVAIEVQRAFAERAAAKGLVLTVDVAADVPEWTMVDRVRLSQVLLNLVGNAVKFTHRGGVRLVLTTIRREADSVEVEFTVSDTGAGIPEAQLRRLFEPFRKLRDDDTPFGGGVGLGLAICRQVVELLGGEIAVESQMGEGATFSFRLELLLAAGPAHSSPALPCVVPSEMPTALAGLRVLLVDDNPHVRELLREFLRRLGAHVVARPDGTSGLDAVRASMFDVILLDLRLPDMDASTFAGSVRGKSGSPQEPWIVGISAGVSDLEIQKALEQGLNDFMLKPVSMAGLAETIRLSPVAARIVVPAEVESLSIEAPPEVRRAFFEESAPVLVRIESFCRGERGRQAAAEAHYLANGCIMLGLDDALAECRELERLAESDDLEAAVSVARRLRRLFGQVAGAEAVLPSHVRAGDTFS